MENIAIPALGKPLKETLNTRLVSFINTFSKLLFIAALGMVIGLVLNFFHLPGEHLIFIFFTGLLTFLLLLQTGFSFLFIFSHMWLAFLGGLISLTVALVCMTQLFLFENWWGSFIMVFLTLPMVFLSLGFLTFYFFTGQHHHTTHRKFLYFNILAPLGFCFLLGLTYLIHDQASPNEREKRIKQSEEAGLREI